MGDEFVTLSLSLGSAFESLALDASPPPSLAGTSFGRESIASYSSDGSSCSLGTPTSFDPSKYLMLHKQAVGERLRKGTNHSSKMKFLYRYWTAFLPENFNDAMYASFCSCAQEDAASDNESSIYGLTYLFQFYTIILSGLRKNASFEDTFEETLLADFERIALSTHDYMGLDLGVKSLVEYLSEHESIVAEAGGTLSPTTLALLDAHKQQQKEEVDPRERLHQRLAEKKSMRSKRRERRDRQVGLSPSLSALNKLGGEEISGGSPPASESGDAAPQPPFEVPPADTPSIKHVPKTSKPQSSRFTLFPRWKKRGQAQPQPASSSSKPDTLPSQVPSSEGAKGHKWDLPDSDALGFGWS